MHVSTTAPFAPLMLAIGDLGRFVVKGHLQLLFLDLDSFFFFITCKTTLDKNKRRTSLLSLTCFTQIIDHSVHSCFTRFNGFSPRMISPLLPFSTRLFSLSVLLELHKQQSKSVQAQIQQKRWRKMGKFMKIVPEKKSLSPPLLRKTLLFGSNKVRFWPSENKCRSRRELRNDI